MGKEHGGLVLNPSYTFWSDADIYKPRWTLCIHQRHPPASEDGCCPSRGGRENRDRVIICHLLLLSAELSVRLYVARIPLRHAALRTLAMALPPEAHVYCRYDAV